MGSQKGTFLGPPRGPPGGPPGGGQKSAHFFGYLITLPVGTDFGTFFDPPRDRPLFGGPPGYPPRTPPIWGTPLNHGGSAPPKGPPRWEVTSQTHHVVPHDRQAIEVAVNKGARCSRFSDGHCRTNAFVPHSAIEVAVNKCIALIGVGAVRENGWDGSPLRLFSAMGGTHPFGRAPPSKQGSEDPRSEPRIRKGRPFARAKRGPTLECPSRGERTSANKG